MRVRLADLPDLSEGDLSDMMMVTHGRQNVCGEHC